MFCGFAVIGMDGGVMEDAVLGLAYKEDTRSYWALGVIILVREKRTGPRV